MNLYWQLNGQRPESNTVVLSEHVFLQVSYFQLKITLAEIQTFLHHAPSCSRTASSMQLPCFLLLPQTRRDVKMWFYAAGVLPLSLAQTSLFHSRTNIQTQPFILRYFCLLCPTLYLHLHSFVSPPCFSSLQHIWLILCPVALAHNLAQPFSPLPLDTDLMLREWPRHLLQQCPSLVLPTPVFAQP